MREIARPSLAERTTLRIGGTALAEVIVESPDEAARAFERVRELGGTALILGGGSNILAHDGDLPLVLVRPQFMHGPEIIASSEGKVRVRVGAGVPMPRLLRFCCANGLSGLENLTGIPGSVGGAIAGNAGSYGTETCEIIDTISFFGNGRSHIVARDALLYGYRRLGIAEKYTDFMVFEGTFSLTQAPRDVISKRMRHNFFEKKSKQPVTAWSAGCVFKNPAPHQSAGQLLEQAGYKGKCVGGMAFSSVHANFLVNQGTGSAEAALALLKKAGEAVLQRFGVRLEPEVRIVPCRSV